MGLRTGELSKGRGEVDLARDRELVERCQAGDTGAFDDLYLRYFDRLYRFCLRRVGMPAEAEDIAQEAFARAWRALPKLAGERRFYPWLSVIASNLCTDALRHRSRTTPVAEMDQVLPHSSSAGDAEEAVIRAEDAQIVSQAFSRLSPRHQQVLQMREESGWSYQRIAEHEGVGISTIEALLWRARQALKREFVSIAGTEGGLVVLLLRRGQLAGEKLRQARIQARLFRLSLVPRARIAVQQTSSLGGTSPLRSGITGVVVSALAAFSVMATTAVTQPRPPTAGIHQPRLVTQAHPTREPHHHALSQQRQHTPALRGSGTAPAPNASARTPQGAHALSSVTPGNPDVPPGVPQAATGLLGGTSSTATHTLAGVPQAATGLLGGTSSTAAP